MKKSLLVIILLLAALNINAMPDVDPIGSDHWKSLIVKVHRLEASDVKDAAACRIYVEFGDKVTEILMPDVKVEAPISKKLTLAKRANGNYEILYSCPGSSLGYKFYLKRGTLDKGVETLEFRLTRIDVNHMVVTNEDGTTYVATGGKVKITSSLFSNNSFDFNTGFGVDVPVGYQYKIEVRTPTKDGIDYYEASLDLTGI